MDYNKLAELLFPTIMKKPEEYLEQFPQRKLPPGAMVTRMGPSPTGFIHLGNLYSAFADERLAHQSGGTFFLRIEDTDDKRYVEGAVNVIIRSLEFFGIHFDEGAVMNEKNEYVWKGAYGPYYQSQRKEIYQCFAKKMVRNGQAYPCFLTEEEIGAIREKQEAARQTPGIYGTYAVSRKLSYEEIEQNIAAGKPYVLRLASTGTVYHTAEEAAQARIVKARDAIRGELSMPENFQDIVILKANGIPTYHFAHVIDDTLMHTTHVVRGAEWLPSLPVHLELFEKTGLPLPVYCHTAQLMKIDEETGQKRKLSKRKDPELSLDYYRDLGYHPGAVREYLLTILNSNFEEWRIANPQADIEEFAFTAEKMSNSGALFDINKLNDVCKDYLVKIPAADICTFLIGWSEEFAPELTSLFAGHEAYLTKILDLGRTGAKPRKDLIYARQIFEFIRYFFDAYFRIEDPMPDNVPSQDIPQILKKYLETYDHADDSSVWFAKIRSIAGEMGYAEKPKDYKKNPELFKGHVGDVSTVIRIALMGRAQSPDVWEIQQILGEERVRARIAGYAAEQEEDK